MADYSAPPGPPPPKVPEGWVARWNDQYKEWFYVNTYTKKSQWDKPTEPARPPQDEFGGGPAGPPPSYTPGDKPAPTDTKINPYDTNPGAAASYHNSANTEDEDARLARQLQAEEDARARGSHSPYPPSPGSHQPGSHSQSPFPGQLPPRPDAGGSGGDKSRGLLGKIFSGASGSGGKKPSFLGGGGSHGGGGGLSGLMGGSHGGHQQYPQQHGGYPPQQQYGGYPQQQHGYGGYPPQQPGYGGYPPQQHGYGGYPQHGYGGGGYGAPKKSGGGMGMAGGAALGLGAGVLGGVLIADAIDDAQDDAYQEGYEDGAGGDDFGGGDF